ncbi:MAG: AAA family ATPase [Nitrososphaeria archaeon]
MLQISRLRIRNLLTYEDSGWIELGRRTLIVGPNGSGKTNIIRALRLLRAAVGLEEIRPAKVLNYLYDPDEQSAGIDLEVVLSDEEVEAAYDLLRYYIEDGFAYLYDFGEHADELKKCLRNVRISMSWNRKQSVDPSERTMSGYHELAFPDLHLRLLLEEGVELYSSSRDYGFTYYDPSWEKLAIKRRVPPEAKATCNSKKELLEKLLEILKKSKKNSPSGEECEKAPKDVMRSCAGDGIVSSCGHGTPCGIVPYNIKNTKDKEILSLISKIFEMASISRPVENKEYGMGYLLLRIILGGLLFAGSERPLSGVSKLSALRGSFHSSDLVMDENSINEILDEVGASNAPLDAYLRNVEPFLAHLSLSSDPGERQRFQKISDCFSKYFHNMKVEVASEQLEVRLRPHPAPPKVPFTPMTGALSEASASLQEVPVSLKYHRIYLREEAGGREVETPIDMAGQGHRELLSLLTALIARPGSVVFLDEPASNMHPTLLSRFLMDLLGRGECSRELGRTQVIAITHSPAVAKLFMEADVGASDLSIIRVYRDGRDGASVIGRLTPDEWQGGKEDKRQGGGEEFLKKAIGRIVDPRVLFAKGVVLVEGPADLAFLEEALRLSENSSKNSERWNELLRNDVELMWMNGRNNLITYDKVLNQLGIPYVAVLDFDALCEVSKMSLKEVLVLTPGQSKESKISLKVSENERKEIRVLTLDKLDKLNNYRYVLLLGSDSVPDQLECNNNSVQDYCNNEKIKEKNNSKKKSRKCELEGFLKGLGMSFLIDENGKTIECTDNNGKLKPERVPECVERQNEEVKGKIKQMGDILFKLINANILDVSTNVAASY